MIREGLAGQVDKEWIRGLVQKTITDPVTGAVLDVRRVVVVRDADGDPLMVRDVDSWEQQIADPAEKARLEKAVAAAGMTVDTEWRHGR